jgi:hypothetical protein
MYVCLYYVQFDYDIPLLGLDAAGSQLVSTVV